ncbi:MAG TPA: uracil-DNA glycosylase family protein [Gammaproteobacteria bacterium]|nr:uracil-DNA glycosylase family protein [Gammaproteobacteria bacterium]
MLINVLNEARNCRLCAKQLPHEPRPALRAHANARLLIIGQAPGSKVHASGIPWDDPSGDRLRNWLGINKNLFYDETQIAIIPMGFCYPGKGRSGDLPPRPECAPQWHAALLSRMPNIQLTLLIGQYAQRYYLGKQHRTLTATVKAWRDYLPHYFALPHPSPRNQLWLKKNPWFETEVLSEVKKHTQNALAGGD